MDIVSNEVRPIIETIFFTAFIIMVSVICINSLIIKRKLQIAATIITMIIASVGLIYYYLCDKVIIPMKTGIIITICSIAFYIFLYIIEYHRKRINATMFAIFLNIFAACIIVLTKK